MVKLEHIDFEYETYCNDEKFQLLHKFQHLVNYCLLKLFLIIILLLQQFQGPILCPVHALYTHNNMLQQVSLSFGSTLRDTFEKLCLPFSEQ